MRKILEIENLSKSFISGDVEFQALKNINLTLNQGECLILKGVSGSGKSTLLSIIGGLEKPTSGKIVVDGEFIAKLPDKHLSNFRAKKVGFIFQNFNLIENLTPRENIMAPLISQNLTLEEIFQRVDEVMKLANIAHKADAVTSKLSGGEKQRTAIARALVNRPKIVICDEPTANLDSNNSKKFIEILEKLNSMKKSIIVATHDPIFENLPFKNRVVHIENGEIV
jgi:putative ABC transport system ATP-binding protein